MPVPMAEREPRLRAMHAEGHTLGHCARELGMTQPNTSALAKQLGLKWDISQVAHATAARRARLAEKREKLQEQLLDDALRLRELLWAPIEHKSFDKFGEVQSLKYDRPLPNEVQRLMMAVSLAVDRDQSYETLHRNSAGTAELGLLQSLSGQLGLTDLADTVAPATAEQ